MDFITNEQFNELAISSNASIKQWRNLPENKIFKVAGRKSLVVMGKPSTILSLVDINGNSCSVWTPNRLREQLQTDYADETIALYLRANGIKECKSDPERWYYDYDIIVANN